MDWGVVECGEGLPIRITIMNTEMLAALQLLSREGIGDTPEDRAATLVGQHISTWLDDIRRVAAIETGD